MNSSRITFLALVAAGWFLFAFRQPASSGAGAGGLDTLNPLVLKGKSYLGSNKVSRSGAVQLSSGIDNDFYLVDTGRGVAHLYVEAKVFERVADTSARVPLNISIVIDRSGSMQGIKMGYTKKAAKEIINQLRPEDLVSIVIYDNTVDSLQPPVFARDKASILKKIDGIVPRASTNLWGGTEMGYAFVKRNYNGGYVNRVLLISDGQANTGLTDSMAIRRKVQSWKDEEGITISTFGVGLDYNEQLMTDMAETGSGNYYFIDAPEQMAGLFRKELSGLLNIAAKDARLSVRLPQGVDVKHAFPLRYTQKGRVATITLRDLFDRDTRAGLLELSIPQDAGSLSFEVQLDYRDVSSGQARSLRQTLTLTPTRKTEQYLTHINRAVVKQMVLFRANERLEQAMALVDRGDLAGAGRLIEANRTWLRSYSAFLDNDRDAYRLDSIGRSYSTVSRSLPADSLNRLQKRNRTESYKLRNKKN